MSSLIGVGTTTLRSNWAHVRARAGSSNAIDLQNSVGLFVLSLACRMVWNVGVGWGDAPDVAQYARTGSLLSSLQLAENSAMMPLYPLFLHAVGYERVIAAHYVIAALSAVALYFLALQLFASRAVAVLSAGLLIVSPTLIFWSNQRLTETLFTFLLIASLLLLVRRRYVLFAVVTTLAVLVRPALDLIAPLLAALPAAVQGRYREAGRAVGVFVLIYCAVMSPWWVHNYWRYGQFVRLNLGDGPVMLLENNPSFEQTGLDFTTMFEALEPYYAMGTEVEVNAAMKAAAYDYISGNRQVFFRTSLDRLKRFFTVFPDINGRVDPVFTVFLLFVYAFAGVLLARMDAVEARRLAPVLLVIAFVTCVHAATHALWRYRAPIEPLLYLLASAACVRSVSAGYRRIRGSFGWRHATIER